MDDIFQKIADLENYILSMRQKERIAKTALKRIAEGDLKEAMPYKEIAQNTLKAMDAMK